MFVLHRAFTSLGTPLVEVLYCALPRRLCGRRLAWRWCGGGRARVLDQPKAQVGQRDEPAEVLLKHDLCGVRVPRVVHHVIDGWVCDEVLHGVAACCHRVIVGLGGHPPR